MRISPSDRAARTVDAATRLASQCAMPSIGLARRWLCRARYASRALHPPAIRSAGCRSAFEYRRTVGPVRRAHKDVLAACPRGQLRRAAEAVASDGSTPLFRWDEERRRPCAKVPLPRDAVDRESEPS